MDRFEKRDFLIEEAQKHWGARSFFEAAECYDRALQLFSVEELSTALYANICNSLGAALEASAEFARAETLFEAARSIFASLGETRHVAMVDLNLGLLLHRVAKFDRAAVRLETAKRGFTSEGDWSGVAQCLTSFAMVELAVGRPGPAQVALDEVEQMKDVLKGQADLRWSYLFQRGELGIQLGNCDAAQETFRAALDHALAIGDPQFIHETESALVQLPQRIKRMREEPKKETVDRDPPATVIPDGPLAPPPSDADLEACITAAERAGAHAIVFPLVTTQAIVIGAGETGITVIDPGAVDFVERFEKLSQADQPLAGGQLRGLAIQAVNNGVQLRQTGDLAASYVFQRFGWQVALKQGDLDGLTSISRNIWSLNEALRDILERSGGPPRNAYTPEEQEALRAHLKLVAGYVAFDAAQALPPLHALAKKAEQGDDRPWRALHRMARIATDTKLAQEALFHLVLENNAAPVDASYVAAAEDLTRMDLLHVLTSIGTRLQPDPGRANDPIWPSYMRLRTRLSEIKDPADATFALNTAFRHLCFMRLDATTGGGAFGHEISYRVSSLLQTVGRDLAALWLMQGQAETALDVAETLLARSMADWLGRAHALWAVPPEFKAVCNTLTGSLNASAVVGPAQLKEVVEQKETPILYVLRIGDGHEIWLVRRDGKIIHASTGALAPLLVQLLPSLAAGPDMERSEDMRDRALRELYLILFPETVRAGLADQGDKLAIAADPSISSIPFAALRTPEGRYLIEEKELVFWPSVTALLNIEASADRSPARRARMSETQPPLIAGISRFDREYKVDRPSGPSVITFAELSGAKAEAALVSDLLSVSALDEAHTNTEALFRRGSGTEIIHLATHGYIDQSNPKSSFLALPDGPLSADRLYQPGSLLYTRLVTLSACRTALGSAHDDSAIGLANGFLIAGAETVLSTLWRIDDTVAPRFMKALYGALIKRESVAAALRRAQLSLLADPKTADPYYWAPFILTGRAENPLIEDRQHIKGAGIIGGNSIVMGDTVLSSQRPRTT